MKSNSLGDYVGGAAAIRVNGVLLDLGGRQAWQSGWAYDTTVACHGDGVIEAEIGGAWQVRDAFDPNVVRAGGGVVAASREGGAGTFTRVYWPGTAPVDYPGMLVCEVSPEGIVVLVTYAQGTGLTLYRDGAIVAQVATGPLGDDAVAGKRVRIRGAVLYWLDTAGPHLVAWESGTPIQYVPRPDQADVDEACAVPLPSGDVVMLERADATGLTLRSVQSATAGWPVVEPGGDLVAPDAQLMSDGTVACAFATDQGEQAQVCVRIDITATPSITFAAAPAAIVPMPPALITSFVKPDGSALPLVKNYAGDDPWEWVSAAEAGDLDAALLANLAAGVNLSHARLCYLDRRADDPNGWLSLPGAATPSMQRGCDLRGVECYPKKGEDPNAFGKALIDAIGQFDDAYPLALILGAFDRRTTESGVNPPPPDGDGQVNAITEDELLAFAGVYELLMRRFRPAVMMLFCSGTRAGSMDVYPRVVALLQAIAAACPGTVVLVERTVPSTAPTPQTPPPPAVVDPVAPPVPAAPTSNDLGDAYNHTVVSADDAIKDTDSPSHQEN